MPQPRPIARHCAPTAEAFLAGAQRWPKGALQVLKQSLLRAGTADGSRIRTHEEALRILCIRAEILSSTPTPAADESLRRDYEMRLLMDGLGQARQADERDWDAMRLEWIAIGASARPTCTINSNTVSGRVSPSAPHRIRRKRASRTTTGAIASHGATVTLATASRVAMDATMGAVTAADRPDPGGRR